MFVIVLYTSCILDTLPDQSQVTGKGESERVNEQKSISLVLLAFAFSLYFVKKENDRWDVMILKKDKRRIWSSTKLVGVELNGCVVMKH